MYSFALVPVQTIEIRATLTGVGSAIGENAASVGDRQLTPNMRNNGFSPVELCGVFRYDHSAPARNLSHYSKPSSMLAEHGLQCPVEAFYCSITAWMVGSGVELLHSQNLTHIGHQM